jgi:hypothetical protein
MNHPRQVGVDVDFCTSDRSFGDKPLGVMPLDE